ncbi:MAG: serine hydrolase domain-containing protein, partial [Verrucomicrobiota bacterium]
MMKHLFITLSVMAGMAEATAADFSPIVSRMQEFVDQKKIAGAVTLVAHRGKVVHHQSVGVMDISTGKPLDVNALFAIASMTKPMTATALMMLVEEGKLSPTDPVSKYIPAFKGSGITVQHCLTHTSGLSGSQRCEASLKKTVEVLVKRERKFQPGEKWQYSPGLNVCGRII